STTPASAAATSTPSAASASATAATAASSATAAGRLPRAERPRAHAPRRAARARRRALPAGARDLRVLTRAQEGPRDLAAPEGPRPASIGRARPRRCQQGPAPLASAGWAAMHRGVSAVQLSLVLLVVAVPGSALA